MTVTRVLPRRLALVLPPEAGESFASWIDRMAMDMAVPPGRVADAIGIGNVSRAQDGRPLLFGVVLTPQLRAAVHAATGVPPGVLDAMQLSVYDGTVLDLSGVDSAEVRPAARYRQWALFKYSRACPQCLADSGGVWRLWWKLGAAVVCPVHARLLLDACPACGIELRRGTAGRAAVLSRTLLVPPLRCGNRIDGRATPSGCDQLLDAVVSETVPQVLLDVQAAYLQAADDATLMLGDRHVSAAEWFACLRAVVAMTRAVAPQLTLPDAAGLPDAVHRAFVADATGSWRHSPGMVSPGSRPPTAALAAALLTFAGPVLLAESRTGLVEAIRPIAEAMAVARGERRRDGHRGNRLVRTVEIPAAIEEARLLAAPRRAGVVAHLGPFAQSPARRPMLLRCRHVPQVVAEPDYRELIAGFLPDTLPRTGRRYAALALARLCGASSWKDAVSVLGIPQQRARALGQFASFRIGDPPAFWRAVAALAARLEQRGPVDYQGRRELLADLVVVAPDAWRQVCSDCGVVATRQRARNAAGWLWAELTGGYWEDAPALQEANWPSRPREWESLYRNFARTIPAALAARLLQLGTELVRTPGTR